MELVLADLHAVLFYSHQMIQKRQEEKRREEKRREKKRRKKKRQKKEKKGSANNENRNF